MALLLGVDTGGTYTDAVLLRDEAEIVASAKALTTRHDLSVGIGEAIRAVLAESSADPAEIGMASLSTTLATNALVEGQGGRVGLIYVGFSTHDLDAHGLSEALAGDPVLCLPGGHDHAGGEVATLDEGIIQAWLETETGLSAFAVASRFATRNPAHEQRIAEMIRQQNARPVSLSHQLSARLNGPKRALTAVLNARLIGMIARLIDKAEGTLHRLGITAPLMVVRGDGALISAGQARERPIETILSGPAASIVGARWMTGVSDALVSDIGGTTTDVALLRDGRPVIDPEGAKVGPWRTMVEAVAMRTTGLGGDSEINVLEEGLTGGITLGPRRVVPVSLIALDDPDVVHAALEEGLRRDTPTEHDGRFVRAVPGMAREGLGDKEARLLERIGDSVQPVGQVLRTRMEQAALRRLVVRGLVQLAGATPSDASHVLGRLNAWDSTAAEKALLLLGRRRTGSGMRLCPDANEMAQRVIDQLTEQTSLALLETAFAEESEDFGLPPETLARHVLMQKGLAGHRGIVRIEAGLNLPVVGLGASAPSYYPAVGSKLGCEMILPDHAHVANAIGAVVGRVTIRRQASVTRPSEGVFRVHLPAGPEDLAEQEAALARAEQALLEEARAEAQAAGAMEARERVHRDIRTAVIEGQEMFIEAEISVEVSGRPRIAH